jgi:trk system potassium uptake protein TrkH
VNLRGVTDLARPPSAELAVGTARVVAGSFLLAILMGTFLLLLPGATRPGVSLAPLDALFTATSAVCVTGLAVRDTATTFTATGHWILLGLIQFGGLGYMTCATVVVLASGRALGLRERLQLFHSYEQPSLSAVPQIARLIVFAALAAEGIGTLLVALALARHGEGFTSEVLFRALFHAVSAYCNAGFDLFGAEHGPFSSLTAFATDVPLNLLTTLLFVLGGLGFPVLAGLWVLARARLPGRLAPDPAAIPHLNPLGVLPPTPAAPRISLHTRLVLLTSAVLLVAGTLLILALEWTNRKTLGALPPVSWGLAAFFQSASARTAGFNTLPIDQLRSSTLLVMGFLMFVGAAPGGTGGGVKVTTLAVLAAAAWASIQGRPEPGVYGRRIETEVVLRALALLLLAAGFVVAVTLALTVTEPEALKARGITTNVFVRLQFEVLSAFGTVGLSAGITPALSAYGKVLIILTMFVGRVGPLTLAVALAARPAAGIRYPREQVWVG